MSSRYRLAASILSSGTELSMAMGSTCRRFAAHLRGLSHALKRREQRPVNGRASAGRGRLRVQLDDVAVLDRMLPPDLLRVEGGFPPHPRMMQRSRQVAVHQACDVFDRLAAPQSDRPVLLRRLAGLLGVDTNDPEIAK